MPHLQSVVIVLLKVILTNVTALVTQANANGQNGAAFGHPGHENGENNNNNQTKAKINGRQSNAKVNGHDHEEGNPLDLSVDELEAIRTREISGKAVAAVLLLLLKWFKLSRRSHSSVLLVEGIQLTFSW